MPTIPTCGHPDRKVFSNRMCKPCSMAVYAKRQQKKKMDKIAAGEKAPRINQVSSQQELLNKAYKILSAELKPLHKHCQGKLNGCTHKATQIHHRKGRRSILLILSRYFIYLCGNCHRFCTDNSKEAKEIGLSLPINSPTNYDFTNREIELIRQFGIKLPKVQKYTLLLFFIYIL